MRLALFCSKCSRELEPIGSFANDARAAGSIVVGSVSGMTQWMGTVCQSCELIYCPSCRDTGPGPCPSCRGEVNPAMATFLPQPPVRIESRAFTGDSPEAAEQAAREAIPEALIVDLRVIERGGERKVEGQGSSEEAAIREANDVVPPSALEVGLPRVVQPPESGDVAIEAFSDEEARTLSGIDGALITEVVCDAPPTRKLLFKRVPGRWTVRWVKVCVATIAFRLPATVEVEFRD